MSVPTTRTATDVVISPLQGHRYPPTTEEDISFGKYFHQAREVSINSFIYLSHHPRHGKGCLDLGNHKVIDYCIYPYKVVRIQIKGSDQLISTSSAVTSPNQTKVVLQGFVQDTSFEFSSHVVNYFVFDVIGKEEPPYKGKCVLRIPMSKTYQNYFPIFIDFDQLDWRNSISSALKIYESTIKEVRLDDQHVEILRCILPLCNPVPASIFLLLDCCKCRSISYDVDSTLISLAQMMNLSFVPIESRLFAVNRKKVSSLPLHQSSSIKYLSPFTARALMHSSVMGPCGCLVYLSDWDMVATQQANRGCTENMSSSSSSSTPAPTHSESLNDIVCEALLQFQQELSSELMSQTATSKPLILIVAATRQSPWIEQWRNPHSLCRRVFSSLCDLSSPSALSTDVEIAEGKAQLPLQDRVTAAENSNHIFHWTKAAVSLLRNILEEHEYLGDSVEDILASLSPSSSASCPVVSYSQLLCLQRHHGWSYLNDMLPIDHLLLPTTNLTDKYDGLQQKASSHWQRLLCNQPSHRQYPLGVSHTLTVIEIDILRAFHFLYPQLSLSQTIWEQSNEPDALVGSDGEEGLGCDAPVIDAHQHSLATDNGSTVTNKTKTKEKPVKNRHIEPVYWEDIGGLDRVRKEILDVLELPFHHPDLFPPHAPRRQGVLLYGPPGTGKTLVAKAVATECDMSFLSVKGPELLDAYVGESEKNVRELFQRALQQAPCVLFFDEIDSLAPARSKRNDSGGGVTDRIVSQLLTELDRVMSVNHSSTMSPVFIIAATNRPDLLDPALLRPGRFDRKIYLGVCADTDARQAILRAQTRKFVLHSDVDFAYIASSECLPTHVTGADLGAVSSSAYSLALERKLEALESIRLSHINNVEGKDEHLEQSSHLNGSFNDDFLESLPDDMLDVQVTQADFIAAANQLIPSVVDLSYYEELHAKYDSSLGN